MINPTKPTQASASASPFFVAMALVRCPKVPRFLLYTFFILSLFKRFTSWVSKTMGVSSDEYSSSDVSPPLDRSKQIESAALIRKTFPVAKYKDLKDDGCCKQEGCAVCLCEFEGEDEIRPLMDCRHIFHRSCLDGWIDLDHRTCPLCRTPFFPTEMPATVKEISSHPESEISEI